MFQKTHPEPAGTGLPGFSSISEEWEDEEEEREIPRFISPRVRGDYGYPRYTSGLRYQSPSPQRYLITLDPIIEEIGSGSSAYVMSGYPSPRNISPSPTQHNVRPAANNSAGCGCSPNRVHPLSRREGQYLLPDPNPQSERRGMMTRVCHVLTGLFSCHR